MSHGHDIHIEQETYQFKGKAKTFSLSLLAIGIVLTLIGIFTLPETDHHHGETAITETSSEHVEASHEQFNIHGIDVTHNNEVLYPVKTHDKPAATRVYLNLLLNAYYILLIAICALFFFALQSISNASWATVFLRIPLAISTIIPLAGLIILAVFLIDGQNIYHWVHYEHLHLKVGDIGFDKILSDKSWFLNSKTAIGFLIGIPLMWVLFGMKLRGMSYKEDVEGGMTYFNKTVRYGAAFTFLFAFSLTILSWVVNMSVDAHWYSTMFSVYNFATGFVTSIAIIALFVLYLKRNGYLDIVTDEHIHDLGKFMFGFSIFWAYLWVSQFLLIWYANIPEEVVYFYQRWEMPYKIYFFMNLIMNFIVPFFVLMTRNNKRNPKILTFVAIVMILGHWNDLYLMLMPGAINKQAGIGLLEIGMTTAFAGLFIFWVLSALGRKGLIPVKHPYIDESVHHDVGP